MASSISQIEEIPRSDIKVPHIRLKIISLNLDQRGESLTRPPSTAREGRELRQRDDVLEISQQIIVKKHDLKSFDHLLFDLPLTQLKRPIKSSKKSSTRSKTYTPKETRANNAFKSKQGCDSEFVVFVQGINKVLSGDKEKIKKTILKLLNKHAMSVLENEHSLLDKQVSGGSAVHQLALQGALLALNEVLDQGVFDITRCGMVQVGQVLTFTLYFRSNLTHLADLAWHSSYIQVFRDAWMGFGCLGAMFLISSMRQ